MPRSQVASGTGSSNVARSVPAIVVKNTLARRGVQGTPGEPLADLFNGPTALAIDREGENVAAKILADFAKDNDDIPKLKAGIVEGNVIDATGILALAKLPSREELLSKVLAGMQGPGSTGVVIIESLQIDTEIDDSLFMMQ